jgi:hypothetical protein
MLPVQAPATKRYMYPTDTVMQQQQLAGASSMCLRLIVSERARTQPEDVKLLTSP